MPILAFSEFRFEITPMAWPMRFTIIPSVFGRRSLRSTDSANKAATDHEQEKMAANPHVTSNQRLALSAHRLFRIELFSVDDGLYSDRPSNRIPTLCPDGPP